MSKRRKVFNPFYLLLIVVGLTFLVTACTYGTMSYRAIDAEIDEQGLMGWIDKQGMMLMLVQVGMLGLFSVCAMATESFWERLAQGKATDNQESPKGKTDESSTDGTS